MGNNMSEFIKINAIKDVDKTLERLKASRLNYQIPQYKTTLNVLSMNLTVFTREFDGVLIEDRIKRDIVSIALFRSKIEDEIFSLYKFKEESFNESDTRPHRDLSICYDGLTSILNMINSRYKKMIESIDFNDNEIIDVAREVSNLIEKEDWTKSENIDISRWTNHAIEHQKQDELVIRNETSQISIGSDGTVKIESQKIDLDDQTQFDKTYELLKLAYESNILLDSRNRGIGKTTALFKLAEEEDLLIVVDGMLEEHFNKHFNTTRFFHIDRVQHQKGLYNKNKLCLVDEISVKQVKELIDLGFNIKTGFVNNYIKKILPNQ